MRKIGAIIFLLGCVASAWARLDETEADTLAHYGPILESFYPGEKSFNYRTLCFAHNGYTILVSFVDQRCGLLAFRRSDAGEMSDGEIEKFLADNAGKHAWKPSALDSANKLWDRDDGAMAQYDTTQHQLAICSYAYLQSEEARRSAERNKTLEGR